MADQETSSTSASLHNKGKYVFAVMALVCVICVIAVLLFSNHSKVVEEEFNEKKAALIKDGLDLKDQIGKLDLLVRQKTEELTVTNDQRKMMQGQLDSFQKKFEEMSGSYAELKEGVVALQKAKDEVSRQLTALKNENTVLQGKLVDLERVPLAKKLENAIDKESNGDVRKILGEALQNVMLVQAGKPVNLDSILVRKNAGDASLSGAGNGLAGGKVLSVEGQDNLILIDIGRRNNLQLNDACSVVNDKGENVASGDVIGVRYDTAAVFIDKLQPNVTFKDIQEGSRVVITKP